MRLQILTLLTLSSACVTTPTKPDYKASEVIERMEGFSSTPDFATGQKVMWAEGGDIFFAYTIDMSGNTRDSACMQASSLGAKTHILTHVKEGITHSAQLSQMDAESSPAFESLTAQLSQLQMSGVTIVKQYFDRREVSDADTGERLLKIHCASVVSVKRSQLTKMLKDATQKSVADAGVREKLLNAQKDFIGSLSDTQQDALSH